MSSIVGIDPGLQGALAMISPDSQVEIWQMPVIKYNKTNSIDVKALVTIAKKHLELGVTTVVIEQVASRPGQSVSAMFKFGMGYGILQGIYQCLWIPIILARPQDWKGLILKGTDKSKQAAIEYVQRRYPQVSLTPGRLTQPHDGIAESICIAEYGQREFIKGIL